MWKEKESNHLESVKSVGKKQKATCDRILRATFATLTLVLFVILFPLPTHRSFKFSPQNVSHNPLSVDWRRTGQVSPVKSQGVCGSCWIHTAVATVESALAIKRKKYVILSEQQLIDCEGRQSGCMGGSMTRAFNYIAEYGLYEEHLYPKHDWNRSASKDCSEAKRKGAKRFKISSHILFGDNEEKAADWIAKNGPVAVGVEPLNPFWLFRGSLLWHLLKRRGYYFEGGTPYWIAKNSAGSEWGNDGFIKIARGHNVCEMTFSAPALLD
ncbi:unnamed protein product, partial [Mesorhabditis belari]|uniref:Peptidase C1A papain C-terminal domain-containing protein n=1 Tax=Mesorhabditis belari TaxID=2138241 RepID=A0AAF3EHH1_9BILA